MKKSIFIFTLLIFSLTAFSQEYGNKTDALNLCSKIQENSFSVDTKANEALQKILDEIGLTKNFVLKQCDNINNAVATSYKGIRYILYDKAFMESITKGNDWGNLFIFAHEVGHHVNGHSLDIVLYAVEVVESKTLKENRKQETEADEFAGFVLAKLGCPISEINKLIERSALEGDDSYSTHPNKEKRLKAVQIGYNKAKKTSGNTWELGSFKKEELPLSPLEIKERFPNQVGGYWDKNGKLLFGGDEFDINHPDTEKIATYGVASFSGDYYMSSGYAVSYRADKFGNILEPLEHFAKDDKGKWIFKIVFEKDSDGNLKMKFYE